MKIIFDFDDTIFDTQKFKESFKKVFYSVGVSEDLYNDTYYTAKVIWKGKTLFRYSLDKQFEAIVRKNPKINLRQLRAEMNSFLINLKRFVFTDFYEFVKDVAKENLFLVSFGGGDFKRRKIKGSGVVKFFSQIEIGDSKAEMIKNLKINSDEKIFVIDDKPIQLAIIKEVLPQATFFRLKRTGNKSLEITPPEFTEVNNLLEFRNKI